jgi:hypothetical protein
MSADSLAAVDGSSVKANIADNAITKTRAVIRSIEHVLSENSPIVFPNALLDFVR